MQHLTTAKLGLFLTAALALTACGGPPTPQQDSCALPARSGEQSGVICGLLSGTTAASVKTMPQVVVGPEFTAAVNAQAQFDLPLPAAPTVESKYGSNLIPFKDTLGLCDPLTVTGDADLKMLNVNSLRTDREQEIEVVSANTNGSRTYTYWWFANKDATVNVNGSCLFLGQISNQTLAFKRGWNVVKLTTDGTSSSYQLLAPLAERYTWTPTPIAQQSLKTNFHRLWLNLDKYRDRR